MQSINAPLKINQNLKRLASYLEEVRAQLVSHYQQLNLDNEHITAEAVKASYLARECRPGRKK